MQVEDLMLFALPRAVTVDYTDDDIDGTSRRGTFVLLDAGDAWLDDRDDGYLRISGSRGHEYRHRNRLIDRDEHRLPWHGVRHPGSMLVPREAHLWTDSAPWRMTDAMRLTDVTAELPLTGRDIPDYTGRIVVDLVRGYILDFQTYHGRTTLTAIRHRVSVPHLAALQRVR